MSTRSTRQPEPPAPPPSSSELDLGTLTIAAVASAAAAFVTSQVWPAGTLWSAAASPVIVAVVKEALRRPATRLQTVRRDVGGRLTRGPQGPDEPDSGPVRIYGRTGLRSHRSRLAIATGLLAFVGVAALYTIPELVAGRSIGRGADTRTTFFGGTPAKRAKQDRRSSGKDATPTPGPGSTATPQPGTTPTPTATPGASPTATATPTPTVTPGAAAPSATPTPGATATP